MLLNLVASAFRLRASASARLAGALAAAVRRKDAGAGVACAMLIFAMVVPSAGRQDALAPGVPLTLAEERAARVTDVRYDLHFTVPEALDKPIDGSVTVRFRLKDASRPLALDFAGAAARVRDVRSGAGPFTPAVRDEHIVIPPPALREGDNEISLSFVASDLALNRSAEFMYTLFVPARARLAFPCFDQPDIKARYTLSLDVPPGWEAVSNGEVGHRTADSMRFAETKPISTYLFAFATGRFSVEQAERNGRRFRMLHRETDAQKVAGNREAIFDLHAAAIAWLERYTAIPYPFDKFDFVLVPSFQFGGMEHPGAIFYNASALLLDPSATTNQKLGRASLISHETSHMWFGDLVTMKWFNDVWMKEVFANFMAAKIVNPSFPEINHQLRFLYAHYPAAYDVDRTPGTNAIRQRLDNLNEAGSLYGAIIYQKAPIVMRQLEMIVGETGLRDGLREYLKGHAFGNASWSDLIGVLDARTSDDLEAWSRAWVERAGRPEIAVDVGSGPGPGLHLAFRQRDPVSERGLSWSQQAHVLSAFPRAVRRTEVRLESGGVSLTVNDTSRRPVFVLPTGGGVAYGDFVLDPDSRKYLTTHLADVTDPLTRGAALVTLWEEMLGARVPPDAIFDMLVAALPRESDELTVQRMLSYLQQAFWKFLTPAQRDARVPAVERMLRAGLDAAQTASLKSAWFNALRDVARTAPTVDWLQRVWKQTATVPGLTLAEPDYITLTLELAVRDVPSWKQMLDEQTTRIQNPDRKAQFQFVRPALSADVAERDAFFASLADVRNRRREAWVLQGLSYLHHPLRAAAAEKHIGPSLEMLREIQRTGDIFFPKRWVDATLSGHQSASAAKRVSAFLGNLASEYPERLRRIVLASADELFRARRLLER
jgi:aminopeptidase N